MKRLVIEKSGSEVAAGYLRSGFVVIGRSPTCDIILRAPGIQPVHFLAEWLGEGEFDPSSGMWSVIDISKSFESTDGEDDQGFGEGVVVNDSMSSSLGGFDFSFKEDALGETDLESGVLSGQIDRLKESQAVSQEESVEGHMLELVKYNPQTESVVDIHHLECISKERVVGLGGRVNILMNRDKKGTKIQIQVPDTSKVQVFNKGQSLTKEKTYQDEVKVGDLLQVKWELNDFYLRVVPKIKVKKVSRGIHRDPFFQRSAGIMIFAILLILGIFSIVPEKKEEEKEPPRIVKIKKAIPKPKPKKVEPVEKKQGETKQSVKKKPQKSAKGGKKQKKKSKPVKKKSFNQVGLLGALSKSKKSSTVSANSVASDFVASKSASANIKLQKLNVQDDSLAKSNAGGADLSKAGTAVSAADINVQDSDLSGSGMMGSGGMSFGLGDAKSSLGGGEQGGDIEGGLDKETVRRVILSRRVFLFGCYERALVSNPKLNAKLIYQWRITPQGNVTRLKLVSSNTGATNFELCLKDVLAKTVFPKAKNGMPTIVKYPFLFQPRN